MALVCWCCGLSYDLRSSGGCVAAWRNGQGEVPDVIRSNRIVKVKMSKTLDGNAAANLAIVETTTHTAVLHAQAEVEAKARATEMRSACVSSLLRAA